MKSLLFLVSIVGCLAALAAGLPVNHEFEMFMIQYAKEYPTQIEHDKRQLIFEHSVKYIEKHNKDTAAGLHTYMLGVNEFADLTSTEFVATYNGLKVNADDIIQDNLYAPEAGKALPRAVDWRKKGYVTGIKNQGQCGSCWAFSAIGSIEGQHFNATEKLVSLSEQNLVDCDEISEGCAGGFMADAFEYVIKNKGVDTEASYPYMATDGVCKYKPANLGATINSYRNVPNGDEDALVAATASVGPISVAIDASQPSFQHYKSGVYSDEDCSKTNLDHAVLVVGYGTLDSDKDYWIVKNSWGTSWGSDGYILFERGNNECGIATEASFPLA